MAENQNELCIACKDEPVFIKKRQLGRRCYNRLAKSGRLDDKEVTSNRIISKIETESEIEFIKNYFKHNQWFFHPATFRFNGTRYTPDFYDAETNTFIEVSGTRQAYHANKDKYDSFRKHFPQLNFEIRKPDGSVLNEDPYAKNKWN